MVPLGLSLIVALAAAVVDARTGRIPNWLTLPAMALALAWYAYAQGLSGGLVWAVGLLGCGLLPYFAFRMGAMGGGDVKLFAALGALNGLSLGTEILMASLIAGCLQALLVLAIRKQLVATLRTSAAVARNVFVPAAQRREVPLSSLTTLRLGPAIFVGTAITLVLA